MKNDNKPNNLHETQTTMKVETASSSFNPLFDDARRIEGGQSPQKVIWSTLPKGIRVLGYFFIAAVIGMLLFALSTNFI